MMAHPTFETLLDFVENRLPEASRQQVQTHLAAPCAACQSELEAIRDMLSLLEDQPPSEPTEASLRRVIRLFQHPLASQVRLMARLVFDSWLIPAALAARGVGEERQVLYRAEGLDIDVQISAESGQRSLRLIGQVMPVDDDPSPVQGCAVRLVRTERVTATTTDELGTFSFAALMPGDYELWLDLPHAQVWIPSLNLQAARTG